MLDALEERDLLASYLGETHEYARFGEASEFVVDDAVRQNELGGGATRHHEAILGLRYVSRDLEPIATPEEIPRDPPALILVSNTSHVYHDSRIVNQEANGSGEEVAKVRPWKRREARGTERRRDMAAARMEPLRLAEATAGLEGKWAALQDGRVVQAARTPEELQMRLRERGIEGATILRVPAEDEPEVVGFG